MERQRYPGDGVVTGWGTVNGRTVYVFCQGLYRVRRLAVRGARREDTKIQDMALQNRAPIIGLFDAGGARIQEGVAALAAMPRCSSATCWPPA
jgi:propionyl-CoA carboxylase beta chain